MNNLNDIKLVISQDLENLENTFINNLKNYSKYGKNLSAFTMSDIVDINTPKGYLIYLTQAEKFKNVQNILNVNEKQELKEFIQNKIDNLYVEIINVLRENKFYQMSSNRILEKPVNAFAAYQKNYDKPLNMFANINNIDVGEHKALVVPFMIYGSNQSRGYVEKEISFCLIDLLKNVKEEEGPLQWMLVNYYGTNLITYIVKNYADMIKSGKDKRTFEEKEKEVYDLVQKTLHLQKLNNVVEIIDDVKLDHSDMYQNNLSLCYNFDIDKAVLKDLSTQEIKNIKSFFKTAILFERKFPATSVKALLSLVPEWKSFADSNISDTVDSKIQEKMKKFFFKERMPLKTFQEHAMKSQDDLLLQFEEYLASEMPKYTKIIKKESKNISFDFEEINLPPHEQESLFITLTISNDEIHKHNLTRDFIVQTIEDQRDRSNIDYFIRMKKPKGYLILEMKIPYSFDYTIDIKDFSNFMIEKLMTNIHHVKNDKNISLLVQTNEIIAQIRQNKLFAILEDKKDTTNMKKKI